MDIPRWLLRKQQLPGAVIIVWGALVTLREIVGLAGDADFLASRDWGWNTPWDIVSHPAFSIIAIVVGIIWLVYIGPRLYLRGSYIRGETVHLADLVRGIGATENAIIRDKIFEDCELIGPAVLGFTGAGIHQAIVGSTFSGSINAIFIPIDEDQAIAGVIGVEDVVIKRCKVKRISIVAGRDAIEEYRKNNTEI